MLHTFTTNIKDLRLTNVQHQSIYKLTAKNVFFQTTTCHIFIHQKPVFILTAEPNELHKIWMTELTQIINFCLQEYTSKSLVKYRDISIWWFKLWQKLLCLQGVRLQHQTLPEPAVARALYTGLPYFYQLFSNNKNK